MLIHYFFETLAQAPLDENSSLKIRRLIPDKQTSSYFLIRGFKQHRHIIDHAVAHLSPDVREKIKPIYQALITYEKCFNQPNYKGRVLQKYVVEGNLIGVSLGIELGIHVNIRASYIPDLFGSLWVQGFYQLASLKPPTAWFSHLYRCTPLILASLLGHTDIVKYLVDHGANLNAETKHGHTALDWATKRRHSEVENYLIQHGALRNLTSDREMEVFSNMSFRYQ